MTGKLVRSKAGHDKGMLYIVVREEEHCVYVADGVLKTYGNPKRKNRKHLQLINRGFSAEEINKLAENPANADTEIKYKIKQCANC